ncbi:MAG TPA: hypothetical protein VHP38_02490 [Ruminiclostridium sp.]|nr:hypothetical protein [Ruminiclostridium sp.]
MGILRNYNEFIDRVNELGFMALSNIVDGFPSLASETSKFQWHTGDPETDPWQWKDRAADEKKLAFGCILGGNKGFVASQMYPYFYRCFKPQVSMEQRWQEGQASPEVWKLWQLFNTKTLLDTAEIRHELGVTAKTGGSRLDRAIIELQRDFFITVAGNRRKLNKLGQPYGWPANTYDRVENWAPAEWIGNCDEIDIDDARQTIINTGLSTGKGLTEKQLLKLLAIR